MSGTAFGSVVWNSATNWQATFNVNGVKVTYSGSIDKSLPKFYANTATASYKNVDIDFTGTKSWNGIIGAKNIDITVGNNVKITGELDEAIADANTVNGSGSWTSKGEDE